ncbi:MAG: protein-glutamate O-methyltransferase CheR [Blautia producta]|nr:protein-glutamate O-methyltransferase CheR [Blautia producta]MCQ4745926.1 protein-glutamate O-methyltransferase CheR [Blautia producta]MDU6882577.1 protein-glutamate O-methyltransferase CheR [Blautia producta]QIB54130.1 protein-glutamate O-methyltransferase CheR [Blautia producta ATCC 27340 = DSM 2950]
MELLKKDRSGMTAANMVNRLTTNYTYFMREPAHFAILRERILPDLCDNLSRGFFNVWCAGCSTGEECYTIAMILQDFKERTGNLMNYRILATDISNQVLEKARKGVYTAKETEGLSAEWRNKYFRTTDAKTYCAADRLKQNIRFQNQNLLSPYTGTEQFDLIFCRNVMIYFDKKAKETLVKKLETGLKTGGYLVIGHAELLNRGEIELEPVFPAVYKKYREKQR